MANIHLMLAIKGGCGKSTLCGFLVQYLQSKDRVVKCFDTDVSVGTFSSIKAYKTERINIFNHLRQVDPILFDALIEKLAMAKENDEIIIDTGGDSHNELCAYITENAIFDLLNDAGHHVFVHTVIVGGDIYEITAKGFENLVANFAEFAGVQFVVWLNPFNGKKIAKGGVEFQNSDLFQAAQETGKIYAVIDLPMLDPRTFGVNISQLLEKSLTFQEGIMDEKQFDIMARSRLKRTWDNIASLLSVANL